MKARLEKLVTAYGTVAIVTYLVLGAVIFASAAIALRAGVDLNSVATRFGTHLDVTGSTTGTLLLAYAAMKLAMPLRLGLTVLLVPLVAKVVWKVRPDWAPPPPEPRT